MLQKYVKQHSKYVTTDMEKKVKYRTHLWSKL